MTGVTVTADRASHEATLRKQTSDDGYAFACQCKCGGICALTIMPAKDPLIETLKGRFHIPYIIIYAY